MVIANRENLTKTQQHAKHSKKYKFSVKFSYQISFKKVGLDLKDQKKFLYLGKLDKNFFIYRRNEKNCWIGVNLFFSLSVDDIEIIENKSEVKTHFWVPLNYFYHNTSQKLVDLTLKRDPLLFPPGVSPLWFMYNDISNKESKKWLDENKNDIVFYDYWCSGYKLPNGMKLWGLTFYMITS